MDDREAYEYYADPEHRKLTGAPRKRQGQRLTSMSSVRFTPEVIEAVKAIAFREGITVGSWIRRLVNREIAETARTGAERPAGLIPGSSRRGTPKPLGSTLALKPRVFACEHMSIGGVQSADCGTCGPMQLAS